MKNLLKLEITVPGPLAPAVTAHLFQHASHGWEESDARDGATLFTVHFEEGPVAEDIALTLAARWPETTVGRGTIEDQDWTRAWREFFTPVEAGGRFLVIPPWFTDDTAGLIPIIIDPKMAFGTGHHGTTALCLEAIAALTANGHMGEGKTFLDLGTGSGILGIACCKSGMTGLGLDIDPLAIENAKENKVLNAIGDEFEIQEGSINLTGGAKYDLVAANILAGPLKAMAAQIRAAVAPGGSLALSGILHEQADGVIAVYTGLGLGDPVRIDRAEWTALMWENIG